MNLLSPDFLLWYFILNIFLVVLLKLYLADNVKPHVMLYLITASFAYMTIKSFPAPDEGDDLMMGMATYVLIAGIPICLAGLLATRIVADFMMGSGDFDSDAKDGFLNDIKMPLDDYMNDGNFEEAIAFLREKYRRGRYRKDYRLSMEIAVIAMTQIRDFDMAMKEFKNVIKTARKAEAISHAMYRISDIYILTQRFEDAKDALRDLIKKYPALELSKSAELKLKLMDQETKDVREAERTRYRRGIKESNVNDKTERSIFDEIEEDIPLEQEHSATEELKEQALFSDAEAYEGDDYQALLRRSIDRDKERSKSKPSQVEESFSTRKKPVFAHHTRRAAPPPIPSDLFRKRQPYMGDKSHSSKPE